MEYKFKRGKRYIEEYINYIDVQNVLIIIHLNMWKKNEDVLNQFSKSIVDSKKV